MGDSDNNVTSTNTGGGASVQGNASAGRDFVGRDQLNINLFGKDADPAKATEVIQKILSAGDLNPQKFSALMDYFSRFHGQLADSKELHNALNDLVMSLDQFKLSVERAYLRGKALDLFELRQNWRPVGQKIQILLDFAAVVNSIIPQPFAIVDEGVQGPGWAVEVYTASQRINELLGQKKPDRDELYDATFDFNDVVERHMYLADKQLRGIALSLCLLSDQVQRSLGHDQV